MVTVARKATRGRSPLDFVAPAAALLVLGVSLTFDVGGWRKEYRASGIEAAAVRSWSDEAFYLYRTGSSEGAAAILEAALRLRPEDARLHHRLGLVESARGRDDAARRAHERARELDPTMFETNGNVFDASPGTKKR
jgi:tetratricopeptide (TPR) repeat protein